MTLTTNLYKKVRDAAIIVLLIVTIITSISTCRSGQASGNDYDRNNQRIEEQFNDIRADIGGVASGLNSLEIEAREIRSDIKSSRAEVRQLITDDRKLGDTSIELGIISDRSRRLLQELERRELKKTETD